MAQRTKKNCATAGCPNKSLTRWCDTCAKVPAIVRPYDTLRGSSTARGYDYQWKRTRLVALRRDHFLCQRCLQMENRPTPATEVHHIIGIDEDPSLRLVVENLMSVCSPCHKVLTIEDQGVFGRAPTNKA